MIPNLERSIDLCGTEDVYSRVPQIGSTMNTFTFVHIPNQLTVYVANVN